MLIDAIHTQSVEHIERTHPLRVTLCQIVIHCDNMHTIASQCIEEHRKRCHERLTFTRCHFRNLTLMQNHTTEELHIIVNHVPHGVVSACHPVIMPNSLVAIYIHKIVSHRELLIKFRGSDNNVLILSESASRIFHNGKNRRHHLVESLLENIQYFSIYLVDFIKDRLTLIYFRFLDFCIELLYFCSLFRHKALQINLDFVCLRTKFIVRQLLNFWIHVKHLLDNRPNLLHIASCLIAKE